MHLTDGSDQEFLDFYPELDQLRVERALLVGCHGCSNDLHMLLFVCLVFMQPHTCSNVQRLKRGDGTTLQLR